ncbi:MAG: PAS domain S-box protein [Bacteroidota bacterium]
MPRAARMVGAKSADELLGMEALRFAHPDSLGIITERQERILKGEAVPTLEQKYLRLDGTVLHVEASGQPYQFEGQTAVQIIFNDITARKKTEANFRKTETLFYQLFQNTPPCSDIA